ncbi:hypothetical protein [Parazoarcus communis]|uniref:Uncharacterized protein n=1 Tax=Parazoarcus communis SWub3 = DSM 12120 TaxID=1121029 RepID=A0A323URU5_9RHOO|nr:hypothetical protein [Parazoarcus communis]NMG71851.1 hypothetical protein [Parazoarcus communis SWub3 = DSM 12120]PZA14961.1 hypothetical protein DNK49_19145 [Azoarcus communis] [Parazoarcus communis SWub3 = DSM 12120]
MDHKRPKLWNGPHALGEGLVRGLELTGAPYLSARAGDVYAGVMQGKGEVKFGEEKAGDIIFTPVTGVLSTGNLETDQVGYAAPYVDEEGAAINPPLGTETLNPKQYSFYNQEPPLNAWVAKVRGKSTRLEREHTRLYGGRTWFGRRRKRVLSWSGPSSRFDHPTVSSIAGWGIAPSALVTVRSILYDSSADEYLRTWRYASFPDVLVFEDERVVFDALEAGLATATTIPATPVLTYSRAVMGAAIYEGKLRVVMGTGRRQATHTFTFYEAPLTGVGVADYTELTEIASYSSAHTMMSDWYFDAKGENAVCTFDTGEAYSVVRFNGLSFEVVQSNTHVETKITSNPQIDPHGTTTYTLHLTKSAQTFYADYAETTLVTAQCLPYEEVSTMTYTMDEAGGDEGQPDSSTNIVAAVSQELVRDWTITHGGIKSGSGTLTLPAGMGSGTGSATNSFDGTTLFYTHTHSGSRTEQAFSLVFVDARVDAAVVLYRESVATWEFSTVLEDVWGTISYPVSGPGTTTYRYMLKGRIDGASYSATLEEYTVAVAEMDEFVPLARSNLYAPGFTGTQVSTQASMVVPSVPSSLASSLGVAGEQHLYGYVHARLSSATDPPARVFDRAYFASSSVKKKIESKFPDQLSTLLFTNIASV